MRVRLFLAIAVTLMLSPILFSAPTVRVPASPMADLFPLIASETLKGLVIGFMGRMFFLALEFLVSAASMFMGLGNFPGMPAEGIEPVPALVSLVMMTATVMIFLTDLHVQVLAALLDSYEVSPIGEFQLANAPLYDITDKLSQATFIAMQATAPFLVYAVIVNLAIGLANRLTPQIPAYFISLPLVLAGGLLLLFFVLDDMFGVFLDGFTDWLTNG